MDDLFVPEPLHRHIMLSAFAEEHGRSPRFHLYGDVKWDRGQIDVLALVGHR